MEWVNCALCGADDTEVVFEEEDRLHHIEGKFRLVRCRQCGLMYINPRPSPEEIGRYYPEDYHAYQVGGRSRWARWDRAYGIRKRCRAVISRASVRGGRILDVGCSTGEFLEAMRAYGWEAYGVEIDQAAAAYARSQRGLEVFTGTLLEAQYPNAFFDVVTLWNVLEHLHYPRATLSKIALILRPGGMLVVSVPNPESIEAKLFGRYWAGLDAPRHLYIYSRHVLERMLNLTGFTTREVLSFTGRHHVLALSVGFWLDDKIESPYLRRWLKLAVASLPMRVLTLPYYALVGRWNQNSVMTVFAQRENGYESGT